MNLKLNYNNKEIVIPSPQNFNDLLNVFQKSFNINEKLMKSLNFHYIDEDNEENILSNDEDLQIFKENVNEKIVVNCIFGHLINNDDSKMIEENKNEEEKIETLELKKKEIINIKDEGLDKNGSKKIEIKDNIMNEEILNNDNLLNEEIIKKENDDKDNNNNDEIEIENKENININKIKEELMKEKNELLEKTKNEKKILEEEKSKIELEEELKKKELNNTIIKLNEEKAKNDELYKQLEIERLKQINEQKQLDEENKKLREEKLKLTQENKLKIEQINELKRKEIENVKIQQESKLNLEKAKKTKEEILNQINIIEKEKQALIKQEKAQKLKEKKEKKQNKIKAQKEKAKIEKQKKQKEDKEKNLVEKEQKLIKGNKNLNNKIKREIEKNIKIKNKLEQRHKKEKDDLEKQLKKEKEQELENSQIYIQEKINQGIEQFKALNNSNNNININNLDNIDEDQLKSNIEMLNEQKTLFQNAIKEMRDEIVNEMNIKYSKLLEQKVKEIHKNIYENIQKQNELILENYIKQFYDLEEKRQLETSQFSQIIISDQSKNKININNKSICKTIHNNIKCENCSKNPIIGYRYKCSLCNNYNLCEECEEKNEISQNHPHDFIKIKNEEKNDNNNNNEEYSYKLLSKNFDFYIPSDSKNEEIGLTMENNSNKDWPENETKLICDTSQSLIGFDEMVLPPIKKGHHEEIKIILNIPGGLEFDTYKVYMNFNVKGKNYGETIIINAIIVSELVAFRKSYNLDKELFSDQKILDALKKKIKWEDAYNYLIYENDENEY